jgi:hypothetical protein
MLLHESLLNSVQSRQESQLSGVDDLARSNAPCRCHKVDVRFAGDDRPSTYERTETLPEGSTQDCWVRHPRSPGPVPSLNATVGPSLALLTLSCSHEHLKRLHAGVQSDCNCHPSFLGTLGTRLMCGESRASSTKRTSLSLASCLAA